RCEPPHEFGALAAAAGKLRQQLRAIACRVIASQRDRRGVPRREARTLLGEDRADAPGKSALLGLDEVTDDFECAPLLVSRTPAPEDLWQRLYLRANHDRRRGQQVCEFIRCQAIPRTAGQAPI